MGGRKVEGHARRGSCGGSGGLCTLCGDEEGKDSPAGWREGVNKVLLKVPGGQTLNRAGKRNYFRTSENSLDSSTFRFPRFSL